MPWSVRNFVKRENPPGRAVRPGKAGQSRSEEHTSELQSLAYLVCRLLLEKKKQLILMTRWLSHDVQQRKIIPNTLACQMVILSISFIPNDSWLNYVSLYYVLTSNRSLPSF